MPWDFVQASLWVVLDLQLLLLWLFFPRWGVFGTLGLIAPPRMDTRIVMKNALGRTRVMTTGGGESIGGVTWGIAGITVVQCGVLKETRDTTSTKVQNVMENVRIRTGVVFIATNLSHHHGIIVPDILTLCIRHHQRRAVRDGHDCDFHGEEYTWCDTDEFDNWNYCVSTKHVLQIMT